VDLQLAEQTVLVTGSTHGIGRQMVTTLAAEGAQVIITGRSEDAGRNVEDSITAAGGDAMYVRMDITREADVQAAVDAAVARYGRLTALVNNAAWVQGRWEVEGPVTEIELEDWERIVKVNLTGTFLASKYAIRQIVRCGGGSVVNVASTAALQGRAGIDGYTASKGAIVALTRSMAAYYSRYDVRVNCLVVGFVDTGEPAIKTMLEDPQFGPMIRDYYMGRIGTPADIAYTTAHLISPRASYLTGSIIAVDHGATATSHMDRQVPDMPGFPSRVSVDHAAAERLRHAGSSET
jgi:NAD(P)-dependent dehydrogenase (short-subunit alcohol dehydrogenase family)